MRETSPVAGGSASSEELRARSLLEVATRGQRPKASKTNPKTMATKRHPCRTRVLLRRPARKRTEPFVRAWLGACCLSLAISFAQPSLALDTPVAVEIDDGAETLPGPRA